MRWTRSVVAVVDVDGVVSLSPWYYWYSSSPITCVSPLYQRCHMMDDFTTAPYMYDLLGNNLMNYIAMKMYFERFRVLREKRNSCLRCFVVLSLVLRVSTHCELFFVTCSYFCLLKVTTSKSAS